jgi:hypothetical protein
MIRIVLLSILVVFSCYGQDLKLVKKDMNEWFTHPAADSLNYYYRASSTDEIYAIDEQENISLVTQIPSNISFLHKTLIINKKKMIYADEVGSNAGSIIKDYYLFNGATHEYLYTSDADLKADHIISGDIVYYHDSKKVYKTSLNSVSDLTLLYESNTATSMNGINSVYLINNFLVIFDYDPNTGVTNIKKIDLNSNQVTNLDAVSQSRAYFYNNEVYYSENEFSSFSLSKIKKINSSANITTVFTETTANQLDKLLNVNQNGIYVLLSNNNISYLANVTNGSINSLNAGSIANPYPYFVGETYSAGELMYFIADDTTQNESQFEKAIWVTDGTALGTKKIVTSSSSLLPTYFSNLDKGIGNCFENIWLGYNSDKTVHLNATTNEYEKYDSIKRAIGFYPIANHSNTYFISYDAFGRYSLYKISCGSGLGLEEKSENHIQIYPNPFKEFITITDLNEGEKTIQLFDLNGSLLMDEQHLTSTSTIDLSSLKQGLYLLKVSQENETSVFKIVKE